MTACIGKAQLTCIEVRTSAWNSKWLKTTQARPETGVIIMMVRKDPITELMARFPNCPRNVTRENASDALKIAVAHISHDDPKVEAMEDQKAAHKIRQQRRDAIFQKLREAKARK